MLCSPFSHAAGRHSSELHPSRIAGTDRSSESNKLIAGTDRSSESDAIARAKKENNVVVKKNQRYDGP